MNKTVTIGMLIILLGFCTLKAQETDTRRSIITRVQFLNDSLHLSLSIPAKYYFIKKMIKSNMAIRMDLDIRNDSTSQKMSLPPIVVQGKKYKSFEKRNHRLKYGHAPMPVAMYIDKHKLTDTIHYAVMMPFSGWISLPTTRLGVVVGVYNGCCDHKILSHDQLAFAVQRYREAAAPRADIVEVILVADTAIIAPLAAPRADIVEVIPPKRGLDLHIHYENGRYDVLPYLDQNEQELARLDAYLRQYGRNLGSRRITITGYCSIEGTKAFNDELGRNRAEGFKRYMMARYGLSGSQIHTMSASKDWAKLREYVAAGNLPYKNEILHIIDTVPILSGREGLLMKLDGGRPYREMLKYIFPKLRRVNVSVE